MLLKIGPCFGMLETLTLAHIAAKFSLVDNFCFFSGLSMGNTHRKVRE